MIAGLRDRAAHPAAGHRTAPTVPAAASGTYYVESSCPDEGRGACFDPFPAGRYSFHKTDPQVTLAVPSGWRNDSTWPWGLSLSRPDTPGATLQLLNDAHDVRITRCSADAVAGPHGAARLVTLLTHVAGLANAGPGLSRIGERRGYTIDLNASRDARGVTCPDGLVGTPLLASPPG